MFVSVETENQVVKRMKCSYQCLPIDYKYTAQNVTGVKACTLSYEKGNKYAWLHCIKV